VATENGSQETLLGFIAREKGMSDESFLQQLAKTLGNPFIDLGHLSIPPEARERICTKVAFQYSVMPVEFTEGTLRVAVSNPFDSAMINAVQFDARCPIEYGLAPKAEIEKALKKYYGVGAETLDEMAEDEPLELLVGNEKEITEGDQEASVMAERPLAPGDLGIPRWVRRVGTFSWLLIGFLIAAGALGNLVDRLRFGAVIDFLDVFLGQYHWPAFNVADSSICVGVGLLFVANIVIESEKQSS